MGLFTTVAPSASVVDLSAEAVDSTTIFISWLPPPFNHQNGLIRSYTVHVNETNTGLVYNHSSTTTNVTVSHLHPYSTYSCTVSPVTVKPGPPSSPVYVNTHEDGKSEGRNKLKCKPKYPYSSNWDSPIHTGTGISLTSCRFTMAATRSRAS